MGRAFHITTYGLLTAIVIILISWQSVSYSELSHYTHAPTTLAPTPPTGAPTTKAPTSLSPTLAPTKTPTVATSAPT
jgi:hypothetical protein